MAVFSRAGEFEDDDEGESADEEESDVFHCNGDHDLHGFANFLFHCVSPFGFAGQVIVDLTFSVFASIIYHHALPSNVS